MAEGRAKKAIVLSADDIEKTAPESFPDPSACGDVSWKTLISAPKTATDTFTVGIATCAPGRSAVCRGHLKLHRHKQAEVYHVTQGKGLVTINGQGHAVSRGSVVWIPGDAEHGIENVGDEDLVWLYAFAADGFEDVVYRFDEPGPGKEKAKL
ncbi:hypothetical protein N0V87_006200 [Didymella glomerata]|jgi:mannose-6-phosphate isomerase-like protein (cupin superfamily)|uniref:Cupin type-2 domain-containing protein n=1 Tax=Didymella glomerata TaxID=749621 RepID=A0A9W9BYQ5_9PLEO|nr:hypothetical protein N0V87_006200 [Didymella glomerata]